MNEYGRVWDETDVTELLDEIQSDEGIAGYDRQVVLDLIATIRDREKTIAEKDAEIERLREYVEQLKHERDMLAEQLGIPKSLVQDAEGRSVREIAENVAERNDGAMKRMEDGSQ